MPAKVDLAPDRPIFAQKTPETSDANSLVALLHDRLGPVSASYAHHHLRRAIEQRMAALSIAKHATYRDRLDADPSECLRICEAVCTSHTEFFREPQQWALLASMLPDILARKRPSDCIRVWCAGCSTGEEVYTIAMLFAEAARSGPARCPILIVGTDVNRDALATAQCGGPYSDWRTRLVPPDLAKEYLTPKRFMFFVRPRLGLQTRFFRHDVTQHLSLPSADLIICRNVLLYFCPAVQRRVLAAFHFVLGDHGILFLGAADALSTAREFFTVSLPHSQILAPSPAAKAKAHFTFAKIHAVR